MPSRCCSRCVKSTSPAAKKDKSNITPSVPDQTSARFPFLLFPDLLPATPLVADPSPVTRCGPCAVAPSTATWRMKRPLVQFRPGNARRLHLPKRPICLGFFIASLFTLLAFLANLTVNLDLSELAKLLCCMLPSVIFSTTSNAPWLSIQVLAWFILYI